MADPAYSFASRCPSRLGGAASAAAEGQGRDG